MNICDGLFYFKLVFFVQCYLLSLIFVFNHLVGAKIRIDRNGDDIASPIRKCTVIGTSDQIATAKGLLNEKLAEDNEIRARRGDAGVPRNRRPPRKLESAVGISLIYLLFLFFLV